MSLPIAISEFDKLSDSAAIPNSHLQVLLGISKATRCRWQNKGLLPKSVRINGGKGFVTAGALRASEAFRLILGKSPCQGNGQ